MLAVDIIAKKRDGQSLSQEEIEFFVRGYTSGEIPDYQAAAFAMAVVLRGMSDTETSALTLAMARSGEMLDLSGISQRVLDKHSSGGVGDKTTIAVAPWVAACGVPVAKMSGRGLGHTGGTIDKLESIPGFRVELTTDEFVNQVRQIGIVVSAQTHELAPADGKLYALRDATATVDSIPLIASSIMSKKIAAGAQAIVLDVKVGSGAFMKDEAAAVELAGLMVKIGESIGRRVTAVISDMSQPLGAAVGNSLEVIEAIETLKGKGPPDFDEHCLVVGSQMLMLAGRAPNSTEAMQLLQRTRTEGDALQKMQAWIEAQGGDSRVVEDYDLLPKANLTAEVVATGPGYLQRIDALQIGVASMLLGGGRAMKGDRINYGVGLVLHRKVGARVHAGTRLCTIFGQDADRLAQAKEVVSHAILVGDREPEAPQLIHRIIS